MVLNMCYDAGNVQHFLEVRLFFGVRRGVDFFFCFPISPWRYHAHDNAMHSLFNALAKCKQEH